MFGQIYAIDCNFQSEIKNEFLHTNIKYLLNSMAKIKLIVILATNKNQMKYGQVHHGHHWINQSKGRL